MIKKPNTNAQRLKRHKRVRAKISGTAERPRLNVFRSEKNIYAQVIDDVAGVTLCSASSLKLDGSGGNKTAAREVGKAVAKVGEQIIKTGELQLKAMMHMDEYGYDRKKAVPEMLEVRGGGELSVEVATGGS